MRVAVDAMGGDFAPRVEVEGALMAAREYGVEVILVGDRERIRAELARHHVGGLPVTIHHASEVVEMQESPAVALRRKRDSSIRVAFDLVREGRADAVVSAGNSGAALAVGVRVLKILQGVERPAIATTLPNLQGFSILVDAGANVDCKPLHLIHFAIMGSVYARHALSHPDPRVGLLSNGSEETKGNELTRVAHSLLKSVPINYVGYVEGRDIYRGDVDVVVCDGFVGNIALKLSEGLAEAITTMLRTEIGRSLRAKLGYLLIKGAFDKLRKKVDYSEYGGAPLLGIDGVGMISHGSSPPKAIKNAIRSARELAELGLNVHLEEHLKSIQHLEVPGLKDSARAWEQARERRLE